MDYTESANHSMTEYIALIDDLSTRDKNEGVSLKIQQFGNTYDEQVANTRKVCSYSDSLNIPCVISAYTENYKTDEYNAFIDIIPNMTNKLLGLCIVVDYNNLDYVNERINKVIQKGGFVRLVKGAWYASSSQYIAPYRWKKLSDEYIKLAKKLINTDKMHILASHDPYVRKHINNTRFTAWSIFHYTFPKYYEDNTIVGIFYGNHNTAKSAIVNLLLRIFSLRTFGF